MNEPAGRYQGRQFGNYQLQRLLGEGGSAEVYLGKHVHLGTEAAIKILDTRLKAHELTLFTQEARTLSTLHHPNIVQILDFGVQEDIPFLVMNYASQGSSGQRYPAGSQLPLGTITLYVRSLARALQYAHDQHVIHRDIKPDNLLINSENELLLSDFGIAVVAHTTHSLQTQDAIGTVTYMAPEQLRGKARPASDQYALGVVVYEWLCGTPPFDGTSIEIAVQHLYDTPQSLRERAPQISPAVERVILRALAKEPQERFPNVLAFAEALEEASSKQGKEAWETPVHARNKETRAPEKPAIRSSTGRKSMRRLPLSFFILALVTLIGGGAFFSANHQVFFFVAHTHAISPTPGVATSSTDWSTFGFDAQHTEDNQAEHTLNPNNIPRLRTAWNDAIGYDIYPPVEVDGVLYITARNPSAGSFLHAIDTRTNQELWQSSLPVQSPQGSLSDDSTGGIYSASVAHGVVYATGDSGMLYAFNARTGATLWFNRIADGIMSSYQDAAPLFANDRLYIHTNNGDIDAIDANTGTKLWSNHTEISGDIKEGGVTMPTEANGVVYTQGSQYLYAFNEQNGNLLWRGKTESINPLTPVVSQGMVYATTNRGNIFAFSMSGCGNQFCSPVWQFMLDKEDIHNPNTSYGDTRNVYAPPAIANGVLYLGTLSDPIGGGGHLIAINDRTGKQLWAATTGAGATMASGGLYTSPVVANGVVYIFNETGTLSAFRTTGCGDADCKPFWKTSLNASFSPPAGYSLTVADGSIYATTPEEGLYALRLPGATS